LFGLTSSSTTPAVLADGTYSVTATATDIAGTTSPSSAPMTIVIDTQTPAAPSNFSLSPVTGSSSTSGITTAHNLVISGSAQAGSLVVVLLDGNVLGGTWAGSNGAWSYNNTAMTLPNGYYAFSALALDPAGMLSPTSTAFMVDVETVTPPVIAGASLATIHTGLLGSFGIAPANDNVRLYVNGAYAATTSANSQGDWSYGYVPSTSTVANGTYTFAAITSDGSGNLSAASSTFQLLVGGGLSTGTPLYGSGTLSGQATAGSLVFIVDGYVVIGVVTANSSGNWQYKPSLSKGQHSIMAMAANTTGSIGLLSAAVSVQA
jgi:hypothetical protein